MRRHDHPHQDGPTTISGITAVPLVWLVTVTFTAGYQKIFSPLPNIGFLAHADGLAAKLPAMTAAQVNQTQQLIFNDRLDAAVCAVFLLLVGTILVDSLRIWWGLLRGTRDARVGEAPFVLSVLNAEEL